MKKQIWGLVALFFVSAPLWGQYYMFTEEFNTIERGDQSSWTPIVDIFRLDQFKNENGETSWIGTSFWAQKMLEEEGYWQVYAGPTFQVTDWLQVGVSGGVERSNGGGVSPRFGSFAFMGHGRHAAFAVYEDSPRRKIGSGYWYLFQQWTTFHSGRFECGVMAQAYIGTGPRCAVNFGPSKSWKFWGSTHFDRSGDTNFQFGLRWTDAGE